MKLTECGDKVLHNYVEHMHNCINKMHEVDLECIANCAVYVK